MRIKTLSNFNRTIPFTILAIVYVLTGFSSDVSAQQADKIPANGIYPLADLEILIHLKIKPKKERSFHPDTSHSPSRAVIESAILPGLGQFYNHKWYKVPFIYTGFSLLTIVIIYNYRHYERDLIVYKYYYNPLKVKPGMPEYDYYKKLLQHNVTQLQVAGEYDIFNRDFQLGISGAAGLWVIQMADAYIDAKFIHSFSMDDNLTIKVSPGVLTQPVYAANYNTSVIPVIKLTLGL